MESTTHDVTPSLEAELVEDVQHAGIGCRGAVCRESERARACQRDGHPFQHRMAKSPCLYLHSRVILGSIQENKRAREQARVEHEKGIRERASKDLDRQDLSAATRTRRIRESGQGHDHRL